MRNNLQTFLPLRSWLPLTSPLSRLEARMRLRFQPFPEPSYDFKRSTNRNFEEADMPTRDDAWKLLCEYTQSESLRKHMLAVEACVRAYARKNGADEELWGIAALLHDFDYERWPNNEHAADKEHPAESAKLLPHRPSSEKIFPPLPSNADYCNPPPQTPLDHALFACDELAGFLTACA